jgi:ribose 5-phosphate isomerase B
MKIALAADHAGLALKDQLLEVLRAGGHEVFDLGTNSAESIDYPDYAAAVGRKVADGSADRGVLVCASGVGMSIAANKIHGIRAALGYSAEEVRLTRAHNDANVLAIGAKFTSEEAASELLGAFLETPFEGGRHLRRVEKIAKLEAGS